MGIGEWVIQNNRYLSIFSESKCYIPTAHEIFMAEFKKKTQIQGINVAQPSSQLPRISMSRFPLELKLRIASTANMSIRLEVAVKYKESFIVISDILQTMRDHIIIESTWYPIVQGSLEELTSILGKANITQFEKITLKQYVELRGTVHPMIVDEMISLPLDKSSMIQNTGINIPGFVGELYPYQYQGYHWLKMIIDQEAGCILADEMGLGKTAQIIALLTSESIENGRHSLVIAPVSLLENWRREIKKFSPRLSVLIHQGARRTGYFLELQKYSVVITSYETVTRDISLFEMIEWNIVVSDEAQAIKNPSAKRTKTLKQIPRRVSIAVTGTPVENRLIDLWSLADFAFPGFLGDIKEFENNYPDAIEGAVSLEPIISPIMLRRRVKDVANDLPKRIDIPQIMELSEVEIDSYETIRRKVVEQYGKNASLVSLIKLRMYCTHPFLQEDRSEDPAGFVKYQRMVEILQEIIENKEKALIFTSYTKMADIMVDDLPKRLNIYCDYIDGRVEVSERQRKIDLFTSYNGSAILVLNPRAVGAGLNITAANHVIHYNLEWNPAVEDQASARSHRRGQTRPVNVYRLLLADTVEETINERVERKRQLSDSAVVGNDGTNEYKDIVQALMRSPVRKGVN
jgi:SNF2 family DNA or RNA helicase